MKILTIFALMIIGYSFLYGQENIDATVLKQVNAQKISKAELITNKIELQGYKEKAIILRNTGITFTIIGTVFAGVGSIIFHNASQGKYSTPSFQGYLNNFGAAAAGYGLVCVGVVFTGVGIPLWIIGGNRKANAEIAFKKFDLRSTNSTAFGIGLNVRF